MHADLERLLAKDLLPDITAIPLGDLRRLRVECSGAEGDVSFVRRLTQGRLDIVGHEARRRSGASDVESDALWDADASSLLFDMPDIMADGAKAGGGLSVQRTGPARPVAVHEPGTMAQELIEQLERKAAASELAAPAMLDDGRLVVLVDELRDFEVQLSTTRRRLHERIDSIQGEIARRYRDGEASIDSLLN